MEFITGEVGRLELFFADGDLCLLKNSSGLAQVQRCGSFPGDRPLQAARWMARRTVQIGCRSRNRDHVLRTADRLIFVRLYWLFPSLLGAAIIFKPETLHVGIEAASVSTGAGSRDAASADQRSRPRSATWSVQ